MIDNRPSTRISDIISIGSTTRVGTSQRPTIQDEPTKRLKKKARVRKDLQDVK